MDSLFRVEIDLDASSPNPQRACWKGMHQCVAENLAIDDWIPAEREAGEYTLKNAIKFEHYSVLRPAYLVLYAEGFPHSVVSQITRHQDSAFLVQSMRYSGKRIYDLGKALDAAEAWSSYEQTFTDELMERVNKLLYFRKPGNKYADRQGKKYAYSVRSYRTLLDKCIDSSIDYRNDIDEGMAEEHARDGLPYNFRQNFMIAGDMQSVFHWMDQRSKADSQLEIRQFAELAMEKIELFCPEFAQWYKEKRYGKARLAP